MHGTTAGDPHTLDKSWTGGSMHWWGWNYINSMRDICAAICCERLESLNDLLPSLMATLTTEDEVELSSIASVPIVGRTIGDVKRISLKQLVILFGFV